ncbi:MAG: hypothetical protein SPL08_02995, partial [Pseudomonadota bacterium]|nr:hypothetical protein [Pseudomonadota bacterium]
FQEGGALRADVLNDELDYQIACQQQIADNLNRSFVLPPYANGNDVDLSLPEPSAGKAIVWNASGTGLENSDLSINAWGTTLLGYKQSAETAMTEASGFAQNASSSASNAAASAAAAAAAVETAQSLADTAVTQIEELIAEGGGSSGNSVTLTGDQSIEGTKTFLSPIQTRTAADGGVVCLNTAHNFQNPQNTTTDISVFRFEGRDSDNKSTGGLIQTYQTDGKLSTKIGTKRFLNNAYVTASIDCTVDDSGNASITTSDPSSAFDASQKIATTKWIENQRKSGNGIGLPNWDAAISLGTGILHTIAGNGWISSSGSVRLNTNVGKQICAGGANCTVPIADGSVVYVSGVAAYFYPSL